MKVGIINKSGFENPSYATKESAGLDIRVLLDDKERIKGSYINYQLTQNNTLVMFPGARLILPTGLYFDIPTGCFASIVPKSGQSFEKGFTVANSPGTIDSDYTKELGVIISNNTNDVIEIEHGEKVCQMIFQKYEKVDLKVLRMIPETERKGGFGSTGIK